MAKLTLVMNMLALTLLWKLASSPPAAAANRTESPATVRVLAGRAQDILDRDDDPPLVCGGAQQLEAKSS
jgi:hypothetical protein